MLHELKMSDVRFGYYGEAAAVDVHNALWKFSL